MKSRINQRQRAGRCARAIVDALEPRRMLAVFNGTAGNDAISITIQAGGAASIISINGVNNVTADTSITINAGGGNDTFEVFRVRSGTTILARGDAGNDTLTNAGTVRDIDATYLGDLTFEGGTGTDAVIADNTGDTAGPYTMELSGSQITKSTSFNPLIEYSTIESLTYRDNDQGNLVRFRTLELTGTGAATDVAVSMFGNGGNDTFFNGSDPASSNGAWDTSVGTGGATIDGGAGVDSILLSNSGNEGTNTYTFNSSTITGSNGATSTGVVNYFATESIDLVCSGDVPGSSFNNTVRLISKLPGTALRVDGRGGNDTFIVGNNDFDDSGLLLSNTTLLGGTGTDSFSVQDQADTDSAGEIENYSWNINTFIKGAAGFNFLEFETQSLSVANGVVSGQLATVPRVDLNATPLGMQFTTITGGAARMCRVDIGNNGLIANINGQVTVNLSGGASDVVNMNDTFSQLGTTYLHTQGGLQLPKVINHSGATNANLNLGPGSDTVNIEGARAGTSVNVNAGDGNDNITIGAGNVSADLPGRVVVNGGSGVNSLAVDNSTDLALALQTLASAAFTDGATHPYALINSLTIHEGPGGTDLAVDSVAVPTTINGGAGDDAVTVGGGNLNNDLLANVTVNGNGGNDRLHIRDENTGSGRSHAFTSLTQYQFGSTGKIITFGTIEAASLLCGSGNDTVEVVSSDIPITVHTGGESNPPASFPQGDDLRTGTAAPATVILSHNDSVLNLSVGQGVFRIPSGVVLDRYAPLVDLGVNISGTIDLGGALLLRAGSITPDIRTLLTRGHNNGGWNGTNPAGAINSSLAAASSLGDGVGYGLGSEIGITSIGPFVINSGDTLIRHTLDGDADLNATVNLNDFTRLAAAFGGASVWHSGDFNYDNATNLNDFTPLAANFGASLPTGGIARSMATLTGFSVRLLDDIL